ncbi:hypothetical protein [Mycobacterium sp.]|uniref:hypothetical protein n=1 Tax=Mycobacterium sp. TaxID=1785 RepID=UPI003C749F19
MQQALRPYVTTGIALVGASMIAVTPVAAPPIGAQIRSIQLVDAWSDFFAESATNWTNIINGADTSAISQVSSLLLSNPGEVLAAFANLTPTVTTDLASLPGTISVSLPPGLELAIADLGAAGATFTALGEVAQQLITNPSAGFEGIATVLNGFFNGQDNISLLNGAITIPLWNGVLAPEQSVSVDLNLTALINALGLGNTNLSSLDLSSLLSQLGLGNLTLGSLFGDLGLSTKGLGTLLGNPTLGTLLTDLGLGDPNGLGVGSFSLTTLLTDLGLNPNVGSTGLGGLLDALGLGTIKLGSLLDLNTLLGSLGLGVLLQPVIDKLTNIPLDQLVNGLTLGNGSSLDLTSLLTDVFKALNIAIPSTGPLSLSGLLGDLNIENLNVGSLLNGVTLGDLLKDLGVASLPVDLTNLGDLSGLTLGGLLGDLGLGDLATVSVDPIGGLVTELVDTVPQQILTALGM